MIEDGRSGRLQLGYSFGRIAVEGLVSRAEIARYDYAPFKWTSVAVAGKVNLPIGYQFEAFGRLGLHHTSVDQVEVDNSFSGSGFLIGGGFEYKLDIAGTGASVFVDYTIQTASTKSPTRGEMEYDLTSRVWTLGATVSL